VLIASRQVPVILVGNKIDLRGGEVTNEGLEAEIAPIMREFKVSATRHSNHLLYQSHPLAVRVITLCDPI
jgi:GTPase SAR1 family protein